MPYGKKKSNEKLGKYYRFKKKDSLAIKALKMAHNVRQLINVEFKKKDTTGDDVAVTQAGAVVLLNGIAEGTDFNERVGRSIKIQSLLAKVAITQNSLDSGTVGAICRVMLIIDKKPAGGAPTVNDILDASGTSQYLAPRNLNNRNRFVILRDEYCEVGTGYKQECIHLLVFCL